MASSPVFKLLYFKNIVDFAVVSFFNEKYFKFKRTERGYAYGDTGGSFEKELFSIICGKLAQHVRPFDVLNPEYYFIIGDCEPRHNLLLQFVDDGFPPKLRKLIWSDKSVKYFFRERDLLIDETGLNSAVDAIFNAFFSGKDTRFRKYKNVIFIKHSQLDDYAVYKTLQFIFGKRQCFNIFKNEFTDKTQCLVSVNNIIDSHVNNKEIINRSPDYRRILDEMRIFINQKLNCENDR